MPGATVTLGWVGGSGEVRLKFGKSSRSRQTSEQHFPIRLLARPATGAELWVEFRDEPRRGRACWNQAQCARVGGQRLSVEMLR